MERNPTWGNILYPRVLFSLFLLFLLVGWIVFQGSLWTLTPGDPDQTLFWIKSLFLLSMDMFALIGAIWLCVIAAKRGEPGWILGFIFFSPSILYYLIRNPRGGFCDICKKRIEGKFIRVADPNDRLRRSNDIYICPDCEKVLPLVVSLQKMYRSQ